MGEVATKIAADPVTSVLVFYVVVHALTTAWRWLRRRKVKIEKVKVEGVVGDGIRVTAVWGADKKERELQAPKKRSIAQKATKAAKKKESAGPSKNGAGKKGKSGSNGTT